MRIQALAVPLCAAALLLTACTANAARMDTVRGDLDAMIRSGAVGAVATLTDNGVTTVMATGLADLTAKSPMPTDPTEHFRVGSITKSFTAAIALQLAAEHRLDLDRSIETYLPGLLTGNGVDGRAITVRQILGHRSGLSDPTATADTNEYEAARTGRTYTPTQEIALALRSSTQITPGIRFEYSNTNYLIAGMLIESVTGRPYADELRDRILIPLNLADTYLPATGDTGLREPHPTGYAVVDGVPVDRTRVEPSLPWTSGALVSTGTDLNRFYTALQSGRVVPQAQLRQMLDGVDMGHGDGMSYGLGVGYTQLPCGTEFIGHVGGLTGFSAIAGATADGRAVTISYTGQPAIDDIPGLLAHALCD
ncbi:serine hydrolase domain-containing protein [Nocardia pseudobrasiliensis]|nr:serine hydrolase domain-containing protein [Nocardia pseudobrasiliensis]